VLFAEERGTGKTMAVEVSGANANADPWRADLSRVMNKYIGETGKSLKPAMSRRRCDSDARRGRRSVRQAL
jgi:ATP-dependent 26S proteasome regulatory subunit